MKHHSPNFHHNLEETEKAEYSYINSGLTILVLLLLAILAFTSCTKEVSKPFPVSVPENRPVPVIITVRLWKAQQSWGDGWLIRITMPEKVKDTVRVTTYWKDAATTYSPTVTIFPNGQEVTAAIWWEAKGEYRDLKLLNVEGEKNVFYTLKIVP